MLAWSPANEFERRLAQACHAGDTAACLVLLRGAELALPLPASGPPAWPTVRAGDTTWLLAFTSVEAMAAAAGGGAGPCRVATLAELAAGWPDPRWRLAVNPGLPAHVELEPGTVARLAVPDLVDLRLAYPEALPPVLQKVLTGPDVAGLLRGARRVSGYVHQLLDVADATTPDALLTALGDTARRAELTSPAGSLTVLRWVAVGPRLYPAPYGGTTEEGCAALVGWVVEEPPFAGMGLGRNPDQVVREYKVDGVGLPHGAELWELRADGTEHRQVVLDGDRSARWWSYRARWRGAEYALAPDQEGDRLTLRLRRSAPTDGFDEVAAGVHVRPVPPGECTGAVFATMVGRWRGEPVQVHGERGDQLVVEYLGGRVPTARAVGFDRVERGVWRARVPRAEVADLSEQRVPLEL